MQPLGTKRVSHFLVILALSVGGAILLFYYQVEFAARLHCPKKVVTDSKRYNHCVGWDHRSLQTFRVITQKTRLKVEVNNSCL